MTTKELIEAFRAQSKYMMFGKFLENYLPEEPEEEEEENVNNG
jgi:hypothetical protein